MISSIGQAIASCVFCWFIALKWIGGTVEYDSRDEPGELSQWLSHDDSTINIVIRISIIIISIIIIISRKINP